MAAKGEYACPLKLEKDFAASLTSFSDHHGHIL